MILHEAKNDHCLPEEMLALIPLDSGEFPDAGGSPGAYGVSPMPFFAFGDSDDDFDDMEEEDFDDDDDEDFDDDDDDDDDNDDDDDDDDFDDDDDDDYDYDEDEDFEYDEE
ncbi:MAG: hypothetical protein LBG95_01175 [Treponema sp.]|nr:hypothetical protein [Treponema sp.]